VGSRETEKGEGALKDRGIKHAYQVHLKRKLEVPPKETGLKETGEKKSNGGNKR